MTKAENNQKEQPENVRGQTPAQVFQSLYNLTRQSKTSRRFYQNSLGLIAAQFNCPYASMYIRRPADIIEEYWHSGPTSPDFWKESVKDFINETIARSKTGLKMFAHRESEDQSIGFISSPVYADSGAVIGAMAIVISCKDRSEAVHHSIRLESFTNFMSFAASQIDAAPRSRADIPQQINTLARAANYSSSQELGFAITNNLRNRIGCDQISLGIVRGRQVKIISISGQDTVQHGSKEVSRIQEAMLECRDLNSICRYHLSNEGKNPLLNDYRLHRQWHEATGNAAVASIPLTDTSGKCLAILSLRRSGNKPFPDEELDKILETTAPLIGAFQLVDRANQSILQHAIQSTHQQISQLKTIKGLIQIGLLLTVIAACCWFCFASLPYRISVSARTIPAQIRHIAAPAEARLDEVRVKAGDYVKQGEVLCRFSNDMLQLQRSELLAEYNIAQLELQKAIAGQSTTDVELARAQTSYLQSRLDILDQRLARLTIKAPYDGRVISGDPMSQTGQILSLGTPLFEVAPDDSWQIEMNVPEQVIDDVQINMTGTFSAKARPEESFNLKVRHINPAAQTSLHSNYFVVRADSTINPVWIKVGMEGIAQIDAGKRPVWWLSLHKVIEYANLHFGY